VTSKNCYYLVTVYGSRFTLLTLVAPRGAW